MFVRFALTADLSFSGEIPGEAAEAVEKTVTDSNTVMFRRGVPKGATDDEIGRITDWKIEGNTLSLTIESGPYTRVHDALFRFRKQITATLGRFRLGLRDIQVTGYEITLTGPVPEGLKVPTLPFISSAEVTAEKIELSLQVSATDLEQKIPDRIVKLIEEKMEALTYGGKGEHWELLYESEKKERFFNGDPTAEMIERGWIKHALSRGQWIHGPQSVQLFRAFEQIVMEEIITTLGFTEMIFPKLVPWEVWEKSGHAKGVYPEIYYVCTPKTRDPAYWEEVGDYFKVTGKVPIDMIREKVDGPIGGLCYAQCPSFWPFVQGQTLASDCLPIRIFDRSGTSHRYESGGIHGIERVDEFHRIEILWLGTPEQVVETADKLHAAYKHLFDEVLNLEWRSAKVTPWFMAQEGMLDGEGVNERIGTTDYEAILPYSDSWLEFQNVSVNGDKYPKGFNVKVQTGKDCWSGCSGIGLERWTAAFLAQKGFDMNNWPERVTALVGEQKELFKFL
ncbi:serine--tRNA ligase [Methanosphaerula palustris]|uniref:tRNA synthetase class II (G H P and S) n=1 Tax=Methanosphaerula palustris (strain ATCC BAA-1556 / DSM 19958 / E1-9c) TaxID=521011 RepID=B8GFN9_METPE|nr:serine--tRNA ligase [Methanosphaerula palustris]ACL17922.1 tRNA synthetase class II (G H P and S) [Methanosphaerula palustris E1-9c]